MKRNRRRVFIAIFVIIAYMLSALSWWTFALIRSQEKIYQKEISVLELKKELAVEYAIEWLLLKDTPHSLADTVAIHNHVYLTDTADLAGILCKKFKDLDICYTYNRQLKANELSLFIDGEIIKTLETELNAKRRAWILEGLTLGFITILIGAAMFFYVDKIVRLNIQQTNFLLAVTHELKTPISATKLALQTISKTEDKKMSNKLIDMAQSNITRLSKMVEQVLLATKFESKFIDPVFQQVDAEELLNKTISELELPDEQSEKIQVDATKVILDADESMLSVVFRNLITNAIKYGEAKPIKIKLNKSDNKLKFSVSDEGMGLDDSDKKLVFQKFYRVGDEKTRTQPGSGLGLYLVKQIADNHNGRVNIENDKPTGTTFNIYLPLTQNLQA